MKGSQKQKKNSQNRRSQKKRNSQRRTANNKSPKSWKCQKATWYSVNQVGGSSDCGQIATIMEPGLEIKSFITGRSGLTLPGSRALLSSTLPSCTTGNHPKVL